jgi:hypothetical protein
MDDAHYPDGVTEDVAMDPVTGSREPDEGARVPLAGPTAPDEVA